MKLIYDPVKDHRELRRLIHAWLASRKGEVISGMSARRMFSEMYGIDIDHHEYAYELDNMTRTQECQHYAFHGGDTQYIIL